MKLVSVIIPVFNGKRHIAEAVESVLAQTYAQCEIIVVDNGSTDGTAQVLEEYGNRIRVITQPNMGVCAARNLGVKESSGFYIAFLDADDMWLPEKLVKQVRFLEASENTGLVHCDASIIDQGNIIIRERSKPDSARISGRVFEEYFVSPMAVVLTSTALMKKSLFLDIGGFDESGSVVDDHDLFLRAAWASDVGYIDEPLVKYRIQSGSLSRCDDLDRIRAHEETAAKCIEEHREYFESRPDLIKRQERVFAEWAGNKLFYAGRKKEARIYLRKIMLSSTVCFTRYLRTFI